jgi:hypothetical protein
MSTMEQPWTKRPSLSGCDGIKRGDILIAHMNRPNSDTAEALAEILPSLVEQGYRFVKLGDFGVRPATGGRTARVKSPKPSSRVTPDE